MCHLVSFDLCEIWKAIATTNVINMYIIPKSLHMPLTISSSSSLPPQSAVHRQLIFFLSLSSHLTKILYKLTYIICDPFVCLVSFSVIFKKLTVLQGVPIFPLFF